MSGATPRNHLFDALRGLAALAVMLFHITNVAKRPMLGGGYLAVDLFFLLSGFVLWNAYGPRLAAGRMSAGGFGRIRLVRLYPVFAAGTVLGIVRALGAIHVGDPRAPSLAALAWQTVATAFLVPSGFDGNDLFPLDNPVWSLSLEAVVNVAFCLWMVRWSDRRLAMVVGVAAVALVAVAEHYGSLDQGWRMANAVGGPVRCAFSFTLGVLMARGGFRVRHRSGSGLFGPIALLALVATLLTVDPGTAVRPWFDLACVLAVFPAVVALAADARMEGVAARIGGALGDVSYPLYATHYPLILPALMLCGKLGIRGNGAVALTALFCLGVASALVPVERAVRRRLSRSAQPGAPRTVFTSMKSARP